MILDVQEASSLHGAAEHIDGAPRGFKSGVDRFHALQSTQDNLALLENPAFPALVAHEKLVGMSIHAQIKKRREALGWSHQRLAEEVSKREGAAKVLAWQTVQQWENGTSAPKRTRLEHVAAALASSVEQLMSAAEDSAPPPELQISPAGAAIDSQILTLMQAFARLSESARGDLLAAAQLLASGQSLPSSGGVAQNVTKREADPDAGHDRRQADRRQAERREGLVREDVPPWQQKRSGDRP